MRKKRFLAVVLSAAMVAGNTVVASAALSPTPYTGKNGSGVSFNATGVAADTAEVNQSVTGQGYFQDKVDMKVFRVVVPTQRDNTKEADLFDFILDPQDLISQTGAARYKKGKALNSTSKIVSVNNFKKASLYFVNSANGVKSLSDTSDELEIINKSTMDVSVSVNAKVVGSTDIGISTNKTFAGNNTPSVYIGFVRGDTEKALSANDTAYIDEAVLGNAKEFYKVSYNEAADTTTYDIPSVNSAGKSESENAYKTYKFKLTGASNVNADWTSVNSPTSGPAVTITYHLKARSAANSITAKVEANKGTTVDLPGATGVESITYAAADGSTKTLPEENYNFKAAEYKLVFTNAFSTTLATNANFTSRDYVVHLTGGSTVVVTLTK